MAMKILVDADACPKEVREVLVKTSIRLNVTLMFIANHLINVPKHPAIQSIQVSSGFDVADHEIVKRAESGDLVITADLPLASEVIAKEAHALSPRGEFYTKETIGARLNMRDFMETMRSSGVHTGGPPAFNAKDKQAFANALDRFLRKNLQ